MKRFLAFGLSILLAFNFCSPVITASASKISGNTYGNLLYGGYVVQQGSWIYYSNYSDNDTLYKIKIDGTGNKKLCDNSARDINIVGDWIYYRSTNNNIYKIKTDGTDNISFRASGINCTVVSNWIYFNIYQNGYNVGVYKTKADGTQKTAPIEVSSDWIDDFSVAGDWIYYCQTTKSDGKLSKMDSDGYSTTTICNDVASCINVVGNWIYYVNLDGKYNIYKIKTNGKGRTKLNRNKSYGINVAGGWIYYLDAKGNIYKIKTDGKSKTKLNSDSSSNINVTGDWVYYTNDSDNGITYRVKTDGTGRQVFSPLKNNATSSGIPVADNNTFGNSQSNLINGGLVAGQGDWIFYANVSENSNLYKIKSDGTGIKKLNSDSVKNINVVGNWIYYQNMSDYGTIYKIKTDGTDRTRLNNRSALDVRVAGDWIYYTESRSYGNYLYRISTDGTKESSYPLNHSVSTFTLDGDWIYAYTNDGNFKFNVNDIYCEDVIIGNTGSCIQGDWCYIAAEGYGSGLTKLIKIKTDNSQRIELPAFCYSFNVSGDWIYYSNQENKGFLYKIKTDGTDKTQLNCDGSSDIHVMGDWIYYITSNDRSGSILYKIKTDGTLRQQEKEAEKSLSISVTIKGTAKVGKILTAKVTPSSTKISYQWYADGVAIKKATKPTFKVTSAQIGKTITVKVTGTVKGGKKGSAKSKGVKVMK